MKKLICLLVLVVVASGCYSLTRSINRSKLLKLNIGMDKDIAVSTMGRPYRTETLQGKDKVFMVYLYYTDIKAADGGITDDELTPLVFDEGKLIGWGWSFLNANVQKYEIRVR